MRKFLGALGLLGAVETSASILSVIFWFVDPWEPNTTLFAHIFVYGGIASVALVGGCIIFAINQFEKS